MLLVAVLKLLNLSLHPIDVLEVVIAVVPVSSRLLLNLVNAPLKLVHP